MIPVSEQNMTAPTTKNRIKSPFPIKLSSMLDSATAPAREPAWNLPLVTLKLCSSYHDVIHRPLHARAKLGTERSEVLLCVACWHTASQTVFNGFVDPDDIL